MIENLQSDRAKLPAFEGWGKIFQHLSSNERRKLLRQSTLEMTRRYANLVMADLQAVHGRVSLLRA